MNPSEQSLVETSGVKAISKIRCWGDLSATGTEGHEDYVEDRWKERDETTGGHRLLIGMMSKYWSY